MVMGDLPEEAEVVVIGGGPGGYAAAFRAADLGLKVTLVSEEERPGGVCLLRGCIPSKTLLHAAELIHQTREAEAMGLRFSEPKIDLGQLRKWKQEVIADLTGGLDALFERRGVRRILARASFADRKQIHLEDSSNGEAQIPSSLQFKHAIIATGSRPVLLPGTEAGGRIMTSAQALELEDIPESLLVVGGGYVGLEMGQVYATLGSKVTVAEMADQLLPNADPDLVKPLARRVEKDFEAILLGTKITSIEEQRNQVKVEFENGAGSSQGAFDRVLIAVGRRPNVESLGLDEAGVKLTGQGLIEVDEQRRTANQNVFAVGDANGGWMLAHEAMHEGRVAAEAIAGEPAAFDARAVPAVVYTDPQVAWCGLSEREAKEQGLKVKTARFPWSASGRARSMGATDGLTKLILDPETEQVLGMGIVGRQAESLIAEGVLAVEMGAVAQDLSLAIHPHPTLTETVGEAADVFLGSPVHLPPMRK